MNNPATESPDNSKRNKRLLVLGAVVAISAIAYSAYYFLHSRYFEATDDAYVASDMVQITSEVSGTVMSVHVDNTQQVQRGQALIELDPADAQIAVAAAEAELARAVRTVRGLFSKSNGLNAVINARKVALQSAREDLQRRLKVAAEGGVSAEELQHSKDQVAQLEAALATSTEELETNNAQVENTTVANHPQVLAAVANLRQASLALKRTRIVAPVSGAVARRNVEIGSRIAAGTPLLAVVPLDNAWVDANFKEVQLEHMRVGQPVEVHSDMYGKDVTYHGKIAGLGAGSGAAFALLPPQNASGNWIKIVQRVPVRISLDPQELAKNPLRLGLSMHVEVDMHNTDGSLVASQVRAPQQVVANAEQDAKVDAKIADIIKRNSREPKTASGVL
ncbi:multidrug resistance protein A [Cellvibrio zantedeschiae]|uniref:Multidrug resistance protein A n=1 Tax=Cellvibrio zantedeschiae TaxID=1237077 RepID=A0ABQ3B3T1_9GAMM|nr:HlyD family efflux transporter periplasmic adaptor subunit [Cellvibrio zantedeschiae]GGY78076.1 multidrug resistance protein A [Cellvibrio zantedeschiae]